MGIHDRDYYREGDNGFVARLMRRGRGCKTLVFINIGVFVIQLLTMAQGRESTGSETGWFTDALILSGDRLLHGEIWRLWTHGFLHSIDDPFHIIFNMLFLWWFGQEMENHYGMKEFLTFYLVALPVAGLAFVASTALELNGTTLATRALGASGAVTAVLVVFAFHYPNHVVRLFFMLPVPIWLFLVLSIGMDVYRMLGPQNSLLDGRRVAFAAHLGGAAFGLLYYWWDLRLLNLVPRWPARTAARARPRLRVYREEAPQEPEPEQAVPETKAADVALDEKIEAQMDAVLEKMSRHGKDSLTPAEQAILNRASELLRRRRR